MASSGPRGAGHSLEGRISVMIDGARELSPIARAAAALAPRAVSAPVNTVIPVILRATEAESAGARLRGGGMRIVGPQPPPRPPPPPPPAPPRPPPLTPPPGAIFRFPRRLPPNIERRDVDGEPA